jgi:8-oxo-dGTP diphosphatase
MRRTSNILDPIQTELDQTVFDGIELRKHHADFIKHLYERALEQRLGVSGEGWVDLYFTGSLTTYQYSETSDADISVFANWDRFYQELDLDSHEARKELVAMSIDHIDGTFLPGTTHPLQFFVVAHPQLPDDMYAPGLRSAYSLDDMMWFVEPEPDRVHDIATELPEIFTRAQAMADKMTDALDHDPDAATQLFHDIHNKRNLDQQAGLGDFSEGNIVYKYLLHEGLFDRIRNELGVYIAKTAMGLRGNLPEGIEFNFAQPAPEEQEEGITVLLEAWLNGERIGRIYTYEDGEVSDVDVLPEYRRMGVATALWDYLRENGYPVQHSQIQTPEGKEWAERTAMSPFDFVPNEQGILEPRFEEEATILFADMKGFTSLCERMMPNEAAYIIDNCISQATQHILERGGSLSLAGDAILGTFATGNHAQDAVEAAIAMQQDKYEMIWRVGINTGVVSFGRQVIGDAVNVAQRLESKAVPGAILVAEYTFSLCEKNFPAHYVGVLEMKGRENPIRAYHIDVPRKASWKFATPGDGDGWLEHSDGVTRWGMHGAAGILFTTPPGPNGQRMYFLTHRGEGIDLGGTWSVPGGAIDSHEEPFQAAWREVQEELGEMPDNYRIINQYVFQPVPEWAYTTFVVEIPEAFENEVVDWETQESRWFTEDEMQEVALHPAFKMTWDAGHLSKTAATTMYHVSRTVNRKSIKQNGLDFNIGDLNITPREEWKGNYLWDTLYNAERYAELQMNWDQDNSDLGRNLPEDLLKQFERNVKIRDPALWSYWSDNDWGSYDIWQVTVPTDVRLKIDPYFYSPDQEPAEEERQEWMHPEQGTPGAWVLDAPIPPEALKLVKVKRISDWYDAPEPMGDAFTPGYYGKTAALVDEETAADLTQHVLDIADQYQIEVAWKDERAHAWALIDKIETPIIRYDIDYLVALHELGHIVIEKTSPAWHEHYDEWSEVEEEAQVWRWAIDNSIIPLSAEMIRQAKWDLGTYYDHATDTHGKPRPPEEVGENYNWMLNFQTKKAGVDHLWEMVNTKVIYDFERDTIILGTQADHGELPDTKIIGDYNDGAVTLYEAEKQWINPDYFHRLWTHSFPNRELHDVYFKSKDGEPYKLKRRQRPVKVEEEGPYPWEDQDTD